MSHWRLPLKEHIKILFVSIAITLGLIALMMATANFCQWRVEQNEILLLERGY